MAVSETSIVATKSTESPHKLDPDQTLKASRALLGHVQAESEKLSAKRSKKDLLATSGSDSEDGADDDSPPIWLNLATKQHIVDKIRLKPSKIHVPHSLNASEDLNICLITTDPQRAVKNTIAEPSFPASLKAKINRVIGITKLAARYKTFESKRQLLSEHDIFLADDRIITRLPTLLGKIFYKGTTKRPIPISISPRKPTRTEAEKKEKKKSKDKEADVAPPNVVAAEIERALSCVPISLRPGLNVSVRVALSAFTAQQLAENIAAVVPTLIEKHVVKGWRNVKSVSIKSPTSFAVPIWLSDDLWAEDENVVEMIQKDSDDVVPAAVEDSQTPEKKRKRNPTTSKGPQAGPRKKVKSGVDKGGNENRKQRLAAQKMTAFQTEI